MAFPSGRSLLLTLLISSAAIVLFSSAGVAHMMGWGPSPAANAGPAPVPADAVPPSPVRKHARRRCPECAVIVSLRKIESFDGGPVTRTADGIAAGNPAGMPANTSRQYEITVRMSDGSLRVIEHTNSSNWREDERLIVIGAGGSPRP